ncbi:MAG: hypothetical protein QOD41_4621 [Cryptosporangiaceae bacterium]|nr:hypothetical protein [Cryptosporangiaceae bacterium]
MLRLQTAGGWAAAAGALTAAAVAAAGLPSAAQAAPDAEALARNLVKAADVRDVNRHLTALQRIADTNGGTRAASTPGHERSAEYVYGKLRDAGYEVVYQEFPFIYEQTLSQTASELSPAARTLTPIVMGSSPSTAVGGITAALAAVPEDATPGCEASDFAGASYAGKIALVKRGSCTFAVKQQNAAAAGAIAVLVYNNAVDPAAALGGTLGGAQNAVVPTAGIPRGQGELLAADAAAGPVSVTLELRTLSEQRTTSNIIAETPGGRADNVVMLGAHLDSVTAGPGINDNGTGSAGELAVALALAKHKPKNKVRFAWWSAEEFGLLGSQHYVSGLSFDQQLDIALYVNFDMIGSPNYGRFVFDGDDSDHTGSGPGPYGSGAIEQVFASYFDAQSLPHEGTDFTGRSDYGPFIAVGIPGGGLFTGAEGIKTADQAAKYGGTAGAPYDACYHQACDNLGNVDRTILAQNLQAMAWATGIFATSTAAVNGSALAAAQRRAAATARRQLAPTIAPAVARPDYRNLPSA